MSPNGQLGHSPNADPSVFINDTNGSTTIDNKQQLELKYSKDFIKVSPLYDSVRWGVPAREDTYPKPPA